LGQNRCANVQLGIRLQFNTDEDASIYCLDNGGRQTLSGGAKLWLPHEARTEALMNVGCGHVVRCDVGHRKPLVYVGFLEVAPWNNPKTPARVFKGLGPLLLRAACQLSVENGCGGRVGLHAVREAEAFSRGMNFTSMDCPSEYNELYMELEELGASALLAT
jgi:hypothetical protein